jgi:hypothetical protein
VLVGDLGGASKDVNIDVANLLPLFAGVSVFPGPVDGQAEFGDGGTAAGIAQFHVSGKVAYQYYFVKHYSPLALSSALGASLFSLGAGRSSRFW